MNELHKRLLFGSLGAALALFCTLYSPLTFYGLLLIGALLMYAEWLDLTRDYPLLNRFGGLAYVGLPVWALIALRPTDSAAPVLTLFALVWSTDIAAYFAGKRFGKHKLWPAISPNKTIEGLAGGMLAAASFGLIASFFAPFPASPLQGLWIGALIAVIAQSGDFFESWLKRRAGVKDSGQLIPGHGGILDRVDGLVFAAPAFLLLMILLGTQ